MRVLWKLVCVASATGAVLASVASCSSGDHRSAASPSTSAAEGNQSGGPFDGLTAVQLRDKVQAEMATLSTMTVTGTATQNGVSETLTEVLDRTHRSCLQHDRTQDDDVQVIIVDMYIYLKGNAAFWTHHAPGPTGSLVAGKWARLPVWNGGYYTATCDFDKQTDLNTGNSEGTWKLGPRATVDGRHVTTLLHTADGTVRGFQIAEDGPSRVLKMTGTGDSDGSISYSAFDRPSHITAPPAEQTVDVTDRLSDIHL